MSERVIACLADRLASEPVVLASVVATRGATPRKRGARMLIMANDDAFSIGGGAAEARVVDAARALLATGDEHALRRGIRLDIALDGQPGAAGVCGGNMWLALRGWDGEADRARARLLADTLAAGHAVQLEPTDSGGDRPETITPDARLLIVGGGHCGIALCDFAGQLDFDVWLFDSRKPGAAVDDKRASFIADARRTSTTADAMCTSATCLHGDHAQLAIALDTSREVLAVLLNRDFHEDVRSLQVLAARPPAFIGMMGSARRIREVLAALPGERDALAALRAPVGLDIGAQSPHEIAISILAQLVQWRAARRAG
jgi:xanthine dehydrogenase accessory factor